MTRTTRLSCGRVLRLREYGDPRGHPVVSCHGGLVDGSDASRAHEPALRLGLRLISPDRPGVGGSTPSSGRSALDWARDVAALADALGIARFSVLGWSLGGVYAAACAYALGERVTRAAIVAGCVPLDEPSAFAELNVMDRAIARLAERAPWALRASVPPLGRLAAAAPTPAYRALARAIGGDEVLLSRGLAGGLSSAAGVLDDYRVLISPWGFAPEDIDVEVDVWHGRDDPFAPEVWGERLARRIPRATLHALEGEGHFVALAHYPRILAWLAPAPPR